MLGFIRRLKHLWKWLLPFGILLTYTSVYMYIVRFRPEKEVPYGAGSSLKVSLVPLTSSKMFYVGATEDKLFFKEGKRLKCWNINNNAWCKDNYKKISAEDIFKIDQNCIFKLNGKQVVVYDPTALKVKVRYRYSNEALIDAFCTKDRVYLLALNSAISSEKDWVSRLRVFNLSGKLVRTIDFKYSFSLIGRADGVILLSEENPLYLKPQSAYLSLDSYKLQLLPYGEILQRGSMVYRSGSGTLIFNGQKLAKIDASKYRCFIGVSDKLLLGFSKGRWELLWPKNKEANLDDVSKLSDIGLTCKDIEVIGFGDTYVDIKTSYATIIRLSMR